MGEPTKPYAVQELVVGEHAVHAAEPALYDVVAQLAVCPLGRASGHGHHAGLLHLFELAGLAAHEIQHLRHWCAISIRHYVHQAPATGDEPLLQLTLNLFSDVVAALLVQFRLRRGHGGENGVQMVHHQVTLPRSGGVYLLLHDAVVPGWAKPKACCRRPDKSLSYSRRYCFSASLATVRNVFPWWIVRRPRSSSAEAVGPLDFGDCVFGNVDFHVVIPTQRWFLAAGAGVLGVRCCIFAMAGANQGLCTPQAWPGRWRTS